MRQISLFCHTAVLILILLFFFLTKNFSLLSTPGFESANLFILFFGPIFGFIAALALGSYNPDFRSHFRREFFFLIITLVFFSLLLFINSSWQKSCSPGAGWAPFFVILLPPLILNIAVGSLFSAIFLKTWQRVLSILIFYILYFSWVIYSWSLESNFRILTSASILISSDLVEGGELTIPLIGFRLSVLLLALALILIGYGFFSNKQKYITRPAFAVLIIIILGISFVIRSNSIAMIGKSRSNLIKDYSLVIKKDGITVKADPNKVSKEQLQSILDEAILNKHRIAKRLSPLSDKNITIWLHKNYEDKFAYTGAKNVHFANPKSRQIHISDPSVPHSVLGHELAHIYIGEYATTIFGVPGVWRIFPNLALTEGLAMMLTPENSLENDLSLREQAQAIFQSGTKPDILKLFSTNPLEFLSSQPHFAYVFSGAFLEYILGRLDHNKKEIALKQIIKDGSLKSLFINKDQIKKAQEDFIEILREPVPGWAILLFKRYSPHSILTSDCQELNLTQINLFKQKLLNNETKEAILALNNINIDRKITLLKQAFDSLMAQKLYNYALIIASELGALYIEQKDQRLHEFLLSKADLYINLNQISEAKSVIININDNWLSPMSKRHLFLMKQLFLLPQEKSPAKETLLLLADHSNRLEASYANMVFALGLNRSQSSFETLPGFYLYARLLFNSHRYKEAQALILELNNHAGMFSPLIEEALEIMLAQCYTEQKNYIDAINIYKKLLEKDLPSGIRLSFEDALERVTLKATM